MTKGWLVSKQKIVYTQMSTAIETRGVGDFDAMSPGTVPCLHVTNRINIFAISISMLAHSLFFSAGSQYVQLVYRSYLSNGIK